MLSILKRILLDDLEVVVRDPEERLNWWFNFGKDLLEYDLVIVRFVCLILFEDD